jgi:hypothetical protein
VAKLERIRNSVILFILLSAAGLGFFFRYYPDLLISKSPGFWLMAFFVWIVLVSAWFYFAAPAYKKPNLRKSKWKAIVFIILSSTFIAWGLSNAMGLLVRGKSECTSAKLENYFVSSPGQRIRSDNWTIVSNQYGRFQLISRMLAADRTPDISLGIGQDGYLRVRKNLLGIVFVSLSSTQCP